MKIRLHEVLSFGVVVTMACRITASDKSFKVSFQYDGTWSRNEWVEYKGTIPRLEEFTVCHWERLHYFSSSQTVAWSYCSILSKRDDPLKCIGLYFTGIRKSANRRINFGVWIAGWTKATINPYTEAKTYQHRTWNHFCWTYSGIRGINKLYSNGQMIGNLSLFSGQRQKFEAPIIAVSYTHLTLPTKA